MFDETEKIPITFIRHAADILGETASGLSGTKIIEATSAYAVEFNRNIPHTRMSANIGNKRTALYDNLLAFPFAAGSTRQNKTPTLNATSTPSTSIRSSSTPTKSSTQSKASNTISPTLPFRIPLTPTTTDREQEVLTNEESSSGATKLAS
jgi:hypothetical protein